MVLQKLLLLRMNIYQNRSRISPLIVGDLIDLRARDLVHIAEATQRKVYQAGNRFVEADGALRDIKRRHNTERELA